MDLSTSARLGLSRHLQGFFDTELCGLYRFDGVTFLPPEDAPHPEGWSKLRRPPYGRHKEVVAVRFGPYDLSISSPSEKPPLGEIVVKTPQGEQSGPLDAQTWKRIGAFIRELEGVENV